MNHYLNHQHNFLNFFKNTNFIKKNKLKQFEKRYIQFKYKIKRNYSNVTSYIFNTSEGSDLSDSVNRLVRRCSTH